jgi:hypothetical protein
MQTHRQMPASWGKVLSLSFLKRWLLPTSSRGAKTRNVIVLSAIET